MSTSFSSPYPIDTTLPEITGTLKRHRSAVLHAPPGAGKTTHVPLALLDVIPPESGRIIMLEPRRIAAVSAARWMSHILDEEVGQTVGYTIRFDSRVSKATRIEVVTEGIFTRRIQGDPALGGTAMVIFDEFHERGLKADIALALCLDVQKNLREDLRILVMSATLDSGPLSSLLGDAPVMTSGGKAFPVEERYLVDMIARPIKERIAAAVKTALAETSEDVLVFLPGSGEIKACSDELRKKYSDIDVNPLYGDLPFQEQERAILPGEKRKIVLATNIAETSLTIEGVQAVIDSGMTKRLRYDPSIGMDRLVTVSISKASAEQRKGRAGRLGPGQCYRLYSRHSFESMVPFAPAEILISDLSSLVLELAVWGVRDPASLSWLDSPPVASWESARQVLIDLGALEANGTITTDGKAMSGLPLHPRLSRLMMRSADLGVPSLGADLAALLSERDIIFHDAPGRHDRIIKPDINERLEILDDWRKGREVRSRNAGKRALQTVDKSSRQLKRLMPDMPDRLHESDREEIVPRLLIAAYPERIAKRRDGSRDSYLLAQGRGARLSSKNSQGMGDYIVAVNLDAGTKGEGIIHMAATVTWELIRNECSGMIKNVRKVEWDVEAGRINAAMEERLGSLVLSSKAFNPSDEEVVEHLCNAIKTNPCLINFSREARQFQGRSALMQKTFSTEDWPNLSDDHLLIAPEDWISPFIGGKRNAADLGSIDMLAAMKARLSWEHIRRLDELFPASLAVPSGRHVHLDYAAGPLPVLAVKLQEMFGLADTPAIAAGRVKVLIHLLSPAGRPVQITQDLKGFWNSSYHDVKKELKGRYPKHPWPDDPWNAVPTARTKRK